MVKRETPPGTLRVTRYPGEVLEYLEVMKKS
jgi:hypothetical protein